MDMDVGSLMLVFNSWNSSSNRSVTHKLLPPGRVLWYGGEKTCRLTLAEDLISWCLFRDHTPLGSQTQLLWQRRIGAGNHKS